MSRHTNKTGLAGIVFVLLAAVFQVFAADTLRIVTWNVENLFDTKGEGDETFTPTSWRRWTADRYSQKLDRLAWVVDRMKPDILFVQEIQKRAVLEDLNARIGKNHGWNFAAIGHFDSTDPRGIDTAIFSRHPIVSTNLVSSPGRRGTLVAGIKIGDEVVWCLGNHWKSQIGDAKENIVTRTKEAMLAREEALKILRLNPDSTLIIAGDFNDDCHEAALTSGLGAVTNRTQVMRSLAWPDKDEPKEMVITTTTTLTKDTKSAKTKITSKTQTDIEISSGEDGILFYNMLGDVSPANKKSTPGSYYYARRKVWNTIDGIIVQPRMLIPPDKPGPAWRVQAQTKHRTMTFALPEMRTDPDERPMSFSRVRIKNKPDNYYEEGYSDHFPVISELIRAK